MRITIEPTREIVALESGGEGRLWRGHSDGGIDLHAIVTRIAVLSSLDNTVFEQELRQLGSGVVDEGAYTEMLQRNMPGPTTLDARAAYHAPQAPATVSHGVVWLLSENRRLRLALDQALNRRPG